MWGATHPSVRHTWFRIISIHAPRVRCDSAWARQVFLALQFQSTHLVWGATPLTRIMISVPGYFNPRTSCEVRRHNTRNPFRIAAEFQSTHLVWGATQTRLLAFMELYISIHAPRVRCDMAEIRGGSFSSTISIHAPRVRCDFLVDAFKAANDNIFQSTHLVWGATLHQPVGIISILHFNPRTSCEVRPTGTSRFS